MAPSFGLLATPWGYLLAEVNPSAFPDGNLGLPDRRVGAAVASSSAAVRGSPHPLKERGEEASGFFLSTGQDPTGRESLGS